MSALSSKICIFHKWNPEKLSTIAEKVLIRNFNAGATIFKAGDRLSALMLIKSGIVRLVKALPQLVSLSSPRTPREKGSLKVMNAKKSPRFIVAGEAPKINSSKGSPGRSQLQTPLINMSHDFSPRPPPSPRSSKGNKGAGSSRIHHVGDWNPPPTAMEPSYTAHTNEKSSAPHTIDGIDAFPSPSGSNHSPKDRFRSNQSQSPVITSTANNSSSSSTDSAFNNTTTTTTTTSVAPARGTWLLDKDINDLYTSTCFKKYGNRLSRAGGKINRFDLLMAHDKNNNHHAAEAPPPKSSDKKHPESTFVVAELLSGQTFGEISVLTIRPTTAAAALAAAELKCLYLYHRNTSTVLFLFVIFDSIIADMY